MNTDHIADFITRIKNASAVGKSSVTVPYTKMKMEIAQLLHKENYLAGVERHGRKIAKTIEVAIAYNDKTPRVHDVKRISKPSRRVYVGAGDIRPVRQGHGLLVLSTPEGIMTGLEAKKKGIGGEVLFEIW